MTEGRLVFACGATIYGKDLEGHPPGSRMCVFTSPQQGHSRPIPSKETLEAMGMNGDPEKLRMNCLIMCPCTVRQSGRKHQHCTFPTEGGDEVQGHIVTCKIKAWDTSSSNQQHHGRAVKYRVDKR